jgi:ABC-type multidrug transport system ATPase subunit
MPFALTESSSGFVRWQCAGKTTLMDVICGRKTVGRTTGELLANGRPISKSSWSRVVRSRPQHCRHNPRLSTLVNNMYALTDTH